MGLFDFLKGFGMPLDVQEVVRASEKAVREKSIKALAGLAEDMAKAKLSEIAAEIVGEKVDEMLGDKASSVPKTVKDKLIESACDKVVDKIWEDVKAKLAKSDDGESE